MSTFGTTTSCEPDQYVKNNTFFTSLGTAQVLPVREREMTALM